ncbi:MAG: hypothetical protein AB7L71_08800, partial [Vicinamibacterales bacterium]
MAREQRLWAGRNPHMMLTPLARPSRLVIPLCALVSVLVWPTSRVQGAAQSQAPCQVTGRVASGAAPLPGVAVLV